MGTERSIGQQCYVVTAENCMHINMQREYACRHEESECGIRRTIVFITIL